MGFLHAFLARPVAGAVPERDRGGLPSDAIFVFAGDQERKLLAVDLWRAGRSSSLIVSVSRFEWRRFPALGLPDGGLRALIEATPHRNRHVFVVIDRAGAEVRLVERQRFGTRREARALLALAQERGFRSVLVVTSSVHVRRASLAVVRAARGANVAFSFETVPDDRDRYGPGRWWRTQDGVWVVLSELAKVAFYAAFLWR